MDPIREQIDVLTRRHFFGRAGISLGSAALASLLAEGARGRRHIAEGDGRSDSIGLGRTPWPASFRAQGQAGNLPVHERRPVADGPVRLQAGDGPDVRQGPARLDPDGSAADHHDQRPVPVPDRAFEIQIRPAWPGGDMGQRALALDGPARRRVRADQDGLDRGDQPRPGGHVHLHGTPASGPSQPGFLAELRPGDDEPGPARLRGDDGDLDRTQGGPGDLQPALGLGLLAEQAPGRCLALQRRPGAVPVEPRGGRSGHAPAVRSMRSAGSTRRSIASSPTPRPRPGSPSTRWPSACRPRSPS